MAVNALVLAEHVSGAIASQTLSIITAASKVRLLFYNFLGQKF